MARQRIPRPHRPHRTPSPAPLAEKDAAEQNFTMQADETYIESAGGSPATPPRAGDAAPPPGTRLGPYELLREIGRGGMGTIFRARDENLRREVAVKILRREASRTGQRLRFIEEAQITGQLEHPGIAPVHFLGTGTDQRDYFAMKLVEGRTLNDILHAWHNGDEAVRKEFPLARMLSIFERICETVGFAHSRGVLHRDLKPSNIMVGHHGEVWVLDWGLAKVIGQDEDRPRDPETPNSAVKSVRDDLGKGLTLDGLTVGTPEYMSPEQARGEALTAASDVFGLGALLYHILTGVSPIRGSTVEETVSNAAMARYKPVRRTGAGADAPLALAKIAEKCLAGKLKNRYATAGELLADLRNYLAGEPVSAMPEAFSDRFARFARRHGRALGLGAALLATALLAVTAVSVWGARKDRLALQAQADASAARDEARQQEDRARQAEAAQDRERAQRLDAELEKQKALGASAAKARKRLEAFEPYAQAMDLLLRGQRQDRAAALLAEALRIDPEFPEAQFALGEALRASGSPLAAGEAYLKADELSRKIAGRPHLHALIAAGFAYDSAAYYEKAQAAFRLAEEYGANDPLAKVGKAYRLSYERALAEAQKLAQEACAEGPHLWETHLAVAFTLKEANSNGLIDPRTWRKPALEAMRKAYQLAPNQAEVCIWLAKVLASGETPTELQEAALLEDRAIELEPANGARYIMKAVSYLNQGDKEQAEAMEKKGFALGVSAFVRYTYLSLKASKAGDQEKAFACTSELARAYAAWPSAMANHFILAVNLGKFDQWRGEFDRLKARAPDYAPVFLVEASLAAREKNVPEALRLIRQGLKTAPYYASLRTMEAYYLLQLKRFPETLARTTELVGLYPKNAHAQQLHLFALISNRKLADAQAMLDRVRKEMPESEKLWKVADQQLEMFRAKMGAETPE